MSAENETPNGFPDFTPMMVATLTMFEMFTGLVEAGFTEDQALTFCAKLAVEIGKGSSE